MQYQLLMTAAALTFISQNSMRYSSQSDTLLTQ